MTHRLFSMPWEKITNVRFWWLIIWRRLANENSSHVYGFVIRKKSKTLIDQDNRHSEIQKRIFPYKIARKIQYEWHEVPFQFEFFLFNTWSYTILVWILQEKSTKICGNHWKRWWFNRWSVSSISCTSTTRTSTITYRQWWIV